jgi:hypothetical protein
VAFLVAKPVLLFQYPHQHFHQSLVNVKDHVVA